MKPFRPGSGGAPLELLAVLLTETFPAGGSAEVWLLVYRKGVLLDAALLAARGESEAGTLADEVTFRAPGRFEGKRRQLVPLHDVQGVEQLELHSTRGGELDPASGQVRMRAEDFEERAGRYVDGKSGEVLLVLDPPERGPRVLYQGNATRARQELAVEEKGGTLNVRFGRGPGTYRLVFDDQQASLTCENPDGTRQRFTRAW